MPAHPVLRAVATAAAALMASMPAAAVDYTWTSGAFTSGVTAPDPLTDPDTLTISSAAAKSFLSTAWTNGATVNHQGGVISGGSSTLTNSGLWDLQDDTGSFIHNVGSKPSFQHSGILRKSAGTLSNFGSWSFVSNGGAIEALAGVLNFNTGFVTVNDGTAFSGAGTVRFSAGGAFNDDFTADNLQLAGGTFSGASARLAGGVDGAGTTVWSGGTLNGSWTIADGTTWTAVDGGSKQLSGFSFHNDGHIHWNTGDDLLAASGTLTNNGLFEAQATSRMLYNAGSQPQFVNNGTLRTLAGVTFTNDNVSLVNDGGLLEAGAGGAIVYNGGENRFNGGTQFIGDGQNIVNSDARFVDDFQSNNLLLQAGTFTAGDGSPGSQVLAQGTTQWTGGSLTGTWELANGHVLTGEDGGAKRLTNFTLVNHGSIFWNTGNDLLGATGTLTNNGLFEVQATSRMLYSAGSQPVFVNNGTLRTLAGVTFTNDNFSLVNDGGLLEAGAGGAIVYNGNENRFNTGTRFTGDGQNIVNSDARFVDDFQSANLLLQAGTFTAGDGSPGSQVLAQGTTQWTGGSLTGTWELANGHVLTGEDGGAKRLTNFTLVNHGSIFWSTGNDLLGASGTLTNNGLFEVQATSRMLYSAGSQPVFVNNGTLRTLAGVTFTNDNFSLVNDGGLLEAGAGGAIVYNGNENRFNTGTRFTGDGQNIVNSDARFVDDFQSANLLLQAGSFTGGDGSPGSKVVADGSTGWTGGTLTGTWELASGHVLEVGDGASKRMTGFDLVNDGSIRWQSDEGLSSGSGTLTNNGRLEIASDADITYTSGSRTVLVNNGELVKTAGNGETRLDSLDLTNNGTIEVQTGTVRLPNGFTNAGLLKGVGSFATTTLTNAGHVAPGASPGTLSLTGHFVQTATGVFDVDIGTLLNSDLLLVGGLASLDGTLALTCFAACSLAVGDEIVILDAVDTLTGTFLGGMTKSGFATGEFAIVYDDIANQVRLQVTEAVAAVPEPQTWLLMLLGLGTLGRLARRSQRQA